MRHSAAARLNSACRHGTCVEARLSEDAAEGGSPREPAARLSKPPEVEACRVFHLAQNELRQLGASRVHKARNVLSSCRHRQEIKALVDQRMKTFERSYHVEIVRVRACREWEHQLGTRVEPVRECLGLRIRHLAAEAEHDLLKRRVLPVEECVTGCLVFAQVVEVSVLVRREHAGKRPEHIAPARVRLAAILRRNWPSEVRDRRVVGTGDGRHAHSLQGGNPSDTARSERLGKLHIDAPSLRAGDDAPARSRSETREKVVETGTRSVVRKRLIPSREGGLAWIRVADELDMERIKDEPVAEFIESCYEPIERSFVIVSEVGAVGSEENLADLRPPEVGVTPAEELVATDRLRGSAA
jgi:hypothetical protein